MQAETLSAAAENWYNARFVTPVVNFINSQDAKTIPWTSQETRSTNVQDNFESSNVDDNNFASTLQDVTNTEIGEEQLLEGAAEETSLGGNMTSMAAMIIPAVNQQIMGSYIANQYDEARLGQGPYGVDVGHELVDQANRNTEETFSAVGSGIMTLGLLSENPVGIAAGLAIGTAVETLGPSLVDNSAQVNATSGDVAAPAD